MVNPTLVDRQTDDAEILVDAMEREGVPVHLAYWIFDDSEGWNFCVASEMVPKVGPLAVLKKFTHAVSTQQAGFSISLENFSVINPQEPFVRGLDNFLKRHPISSPFRLRGTSIEGTFVEDCYVFPRRVTSK